MLLVKTAATPVNAQVGDIITYSFLVSNEGNVPLTNVTVDDARIAVAGLAVPDLAVGASETVTADYAITATDIADGNITNQAIAKGTDPQGTDVNDTSDDNSPTEDDPTIVPLGDAPLAVLDADLDNVVGTAVEVNVVNNDTDPNNDLDPATVNITTPGATDTDGDGDNDSLVVPNEGTWTVDPTTGAYYIYTRCWIYR